MGETGEEKRSKTLTPTRQTSDKLFCGHSPPPPSSSGLHFLAASIQPRATLPPPQPHSLAGSHTSSGPHPAGPGTQKKLVLASVWNPAVLGGSAGIEPPVT